MKQKFTSTIAGASIFISLLGLFSRGLGFIREMIFASNFGVETEFDLYLVGAVLPVTINTVILYIGQNFFVPLFQKVNSTDSETSQKYYNQAFILFVTTGIILALILFFISDAIINLYMQNTLPENKETASIIFKIFLLTVPFSAGISMLSALLQTLYEFRYPAVSALFLNISIIVMLILFTNKMHIFVIPAGYMIGTVFQFSYLLLKSKFYFRPNIRTYPKENYTFKSILSSALLIIILIESISQLYSIFDRYFYGNVSAGGIASLNYAMIIWILPISIFSISLATVIFPKISKAINNSSKEEIDKIYNDSLSMNTLIFMPIAFIFFFYGDILIRLFFERGKFIEESTQITFDVLRYYSLSIVFYSVYSVFNKIFYSINLAKYLLVITIIGLLIKFILNFLLIDLQQNGLALSTSISFFFFFVSSYVILSNKLKIKDRLLFVKEFVSQFINCLICLLIVYIFSVLVGANISIKLISIFVFMLLYLMNLLLLNHKSAKIVIDILRRYFPNRFRIKI